MLITHEETTNVWDRFICKTCRLVWHYWSVTKGNDELTKEFYLYFWDNVRDTYISSVGITISVSQKKSIMKLIVKRIRIRDLLKIGNPCHSSKLTIKYPQTFLPQKSKRFYQCYLVMNKLLMSKVDSLMKHVDCYTTLLK